MTIIIEQIRKELRMHASHKRGTHSAMFFKTGKGQYGEGDVFIGVKVPDTRAIAKKFNAVPLPVVEELLHSKIHEERLLGLFILTDRYTKERDRRAKERYADFYLKNIKQVNNWDLVDQSAPRILGAHLHENAQKKTLLYTLARSQSLWERRISIIATLAFIVKGEFSDTIAISEALLHDKHDLIHKAVGWMLREMGKRDERELLTFLDKHAKKMPRTMLRYAIERLPEKKRKQYMMK